MNGMQWPDGAVEAIEREYGNASNTVWIKRLLEEVFTLLNIEEGELKATKREGRVTAQWASQVTR